MGQAAAGGRDRERGVGEIAGSVTQATDYLGQPTLSDARAGCGFAVTIHNAASKIMRNKFIIINSDRY